MLVNDVLAKNERLISDIIVVCEKQNLGVYLVIWGDSLDHDLLVTVLNQFGFERNL